MPAPSPFAAALAYQRHRPEQTALYSIVSEHYPRFVQEIERAGGHLPGFVRQEFEDYLQCGLLEHGFLRVKCDGCRHEHLAGASHRLVGEVSGHLKKIRTGSYGRKSQVILV